MTTFQARIDIIIGRSAPDEYDPSVGMYPKKDFVVTRDADGNPLSYYGQLAWNRAPYGTGQEGAWLYFDYWRPRHAMPSNVDAMANLNPARTARTDEIRWLMFILIYLRPDNALSNGSLGHYCTLACELAALSESKALSIGELLGESQLLISFADSAPGRADILAALLKLLKWLGQDRVGFTVVCNDSIGKIRRIASTYARRTLQTPPLPTRIYSHILSSLSAEISEFESIIDRLLTLLADCANDSSHGRHISLQRKRSPGQHFRPDFSEALQHNQLQAFWAQKGYKKNAKSLSVVLTEIMGCCYLQIQAFTGMRFNEVHSLPHFCLKKMIANGGEHYIVKGRVTKLTGGKIKRAQWVTSDAGRRAIVLAQKVSTAIYSLAGEKPKPTINRINSNYLFVSTTLCLPSSRPAINKPPALALAKYGFRRLRSILEVPVFEEDLKELEMIDPERDWRSQLPIGQRWRFASHQLRRSLALYAHASGLVSLPSLRRQLQHITREMSLYYARGSQFAKDFVGQDDDGETHFAIEWQESDAEAQYLSHKINVEMTCPDELAGAYSLWYERNIRVKGISLDRNTTLREFQQGIRSYHETYVGGCAKVGKCNVNLTDPMNLECLLKDCKNQVIKLHRFERMILAQTNFVKELADKGADLPETQIEQKILFFMKEKLRQIREAKL
jgi:hypothetical protein